jgi:hypothetical protein
MSPLYIVQRSKSQDAHQLKPMQGFALPVALLSSDNTGIKYPIRGVLRIFEQGVVLGVSQAVFHAELPGGALGAPVRANNPTFIYPAEAITES